MPVWYGRQTQQQIVPGSFQAFGIEVESRHGDAVEIVQMIDFAQRLAQFQVEHYVLSIFCDSKCRMYSIELSSAVRWGDPVFKCIARTAAETFSSWFSMLGTILDSPPPGNDPEEHSQWRRDFEEQIGRDGD